jgi:hypothetical protein
MNNFFNFKKINLLNIGWHILPPIIFFIFVISVFPIRDVFSFDTDEGINLIKSLLLMRGYPLYSATWSDQPPLLTYLLAGVFKLFGLDVNIGRGLILFFAALLVWSFTQYMLRITNRWCTLIGLLLLLVLPYFAQLSVSVMVGLPAVALGSVALLFITLWHQTKKGYWLILSGVIVALSMLIKLITGIFLPIYIGGIFIDEYSSNKQRGNPWFQLPSLFLFCASFAASITTGILFLIGPTYIGQLVLNHISYYYKITTAAIAVLPIIIALIVAIFFIKVWRRTRRPYWLVLAMVILAFFMSAIYFFVAKSENGIQSGINFLEVSTIKTYIKQIFEFIWYFNKLFILWVLAVFGCIRVIKTKRVLAFYAVAWATAGWLFLCIWRPIWYHHWVLFTIPAAILASIAFVESESTLRQSFLARGQTGPWQWLKRLRYHEWASIFIMLLFIINWGGMGIGLYSDVQKITSSIEQPGNDNQISNELMSKIMDYASRTKWMITDAPMFAFRANIPIPPNLAVISHKRIWSGELLKEQIGETIEAYQPELILFSGKIDMNFLIKKYMDLSYEQIFSENPYKLFLRNDIYNQANP